MSESLRSRLQRATVATIVCLAAFTLAPRPAVADDLAGGQRPGGPAIVDRRLRDFEALHRELAPPREAWRALPWHTSVIAAQAQAAREKKPVYMLVRSGHPLACV